MQQRHKNYTIKTSQKRLRNGGAKFSITMATNDNKKSITKQLGGGGIGDGDGDGVLGRI